MKYNELALKIKEWRSRKGLSQEQLADTAQINLRTVQRIEGGEVEPRGDTLKRIANALQITPDELIDWAEQEDNGFLTFLNLSALSFLAFPLLGIIVPFAIWMLKKDKIKGLNEAGKRLLNFQISWCTVLFMIYIMFILAVVTGIRVPLPRFTLGNMGRTEILILVAPILYGINITVILINSIRTYRGLPVVYKPSFRFLK